MRVIGVSLFTKRLCFRPELEAASSHILWTNDTGSKGGRVLKKMTAGSQPKAFGLRLCSSLHSVSTRMFENNGTEVGFWMSSTSFLISASMSLVCAPSSVSAAPSISRSP